MEEEGKQAPGPERPRTYQGLVHGRVLEPSASFVAEMKAAQEAVSPQPEPSSQHAQQAPPLATEPPQREPVDTPYGNAATDPNVTERTFSPTSPNSVASSSADRSSSKILIVRVLAVVIVLINGINAYNWFLSPHTDIGDLVSILGIGLSTALGVGILLLNETARLVYVVLSAIVFALTCFGLFQLLIHGDAVLVTGNTTSAITTKSQVEQSIQAVDNNPRYTEAQKQQSLHFLQEELKYAPASETDQTIRQYVTYGLFFATTVFPLILLTRPAIKEVFS